MRFLTSLIIILTCQQGFTQTVEIKNYPTQAIMDAAISNISENLFLLQERDLRAARASLPNNLTEEERKTSLNNKLRQKNQEHLAHLPKGDDSQFTRADAEELQRLLLAHPVVGNEALAKYDPKRKIGFCFGRATYVHMELSRRGVSPKNIVKIFALGKLYNGYAGWDFHVSTLVKTDKEEWLAIDSLMPSPTPISEWMEAVSKWNADPTGAPLLFYVTDAVKFQPTPGAYDKERFELPVYNGYFKDLIGSLREGPKLAP